MIPAFFVFLSCCIPFAARFFPRSLRQHVIDHLRQVKQDDLLLEKEEYFSFLPSAERSQNKNSKRKCRFSQKCARNAPSLCKKVLLEICGNSTNFFVAEIEKIAKRLPRANHKIWAQYPVFRPADTREAPWPKYFAIYIYIMKIMKFLHLKPARVVKIQYFPFNLRLHLFR